MDAFKGKYTRSSAEQYEEFLKVKIGHFFLFSTSIASNQALDVGMLLRKAATFSTPVMDITEADGTWNIKTSTTMKTMELKFKV